jgi:protein-tyrosine-phosphatase
VRSESDRRRVYLRLASDVLRGLQPAEQRRASRVVFVCTHNSARSQLARALWQQVSDVPAASAGTHPAPRVHPRAVRIARRHGLALGAVRPAHVQDVLDAGDLVVTVCDSAHEELDPHAGARPEAALHWSVPDPALVDTDAAFEAAFAQVAARVDVLAPSIRPA